MVDKRKKLEKERARERRKEGFVRESSGIYISDDELISLIEERVPRIIRDKPYLKDRFRELFSDVFVEKRDIDKVLEEMRMEREEDRKRREEDRKRWEEANKRFEAITLEIKQLREDTNKRFEEMREDTNKRFEEMREDTNRRFEEMREDMNKRFEAVDKRFEALTLEIKQLREDTNKRFEAITFEMKQMREDMNRRFEAVDRRFEEMFGELKRMRQDLHNAISSIGSRWGIMAEDSFRIALEEFAKEFGFTVSKWRGRDEMGEFFLYPRDVEIDILIRNHKTFAVEMKSALTKGEVEDFERAVRLYEKVEGRKVDGKYIVTVLPYPNVREYVQTFGIKVLSRLEEMVDK